MSDGEARGIELGIKRELWLSRQWEYRWTRSV